MSRHDNLYRDIDSFQDLEWERRLDEQRFAEEKYRRSNPKPVNLSAHEEILSLYS